MMTAHGGALVIILSQLFMRTQRRYLGRYGCRTLYLSSGKDSFRHFAELSIENTKIEHTVTAISGDNKGCVWVAVESQGLFCYDLEEGKLRNYTLKNFPFISTNVQSFVFDNSGTLWIGCYGDGLFFSKDRLQTLHPYVSPVDNQKLMRMMS